MISVCIITKNEQNKLEQCLSVLSGCPVEIVVVDTGSTDASVETARKYTESVYFFQWCNDFSKARNYAASMAHNDIILALDTDEIIEYADWNGLESFMKTHTQMAGRINRNNRFERDGETVNGYEWITRIYDRRCFEYTGSIHEQVTALNGADYNTFDADIRIIHTGYNGSTRELFDKTQRNIALLEKELDSKPEDTYILYQLGKSYYMRQEYARACEYFERATEYDLDPRLEYVSDMVTTYGYALLNTNQEQKAFGLTALYDELGYTADFRFLLGLICMNNMRFEEAVKYFSLATQCDSYVVEGTNSFKALYNIGVIYECLGDRAKAKEYYSKCTGYTKAMERLDKLS